MRVLLLLLALAVLALYLTLGLRLGYATLTPLYLLNAQGQTDYPFRMYEAGKLEVSGSCQGSSGLATLRFLAPDGTELSAVRCPPGHWSLKMGGSGEVGIYTLSVAYEHYTGRLELSSSY